MNTMSEAVIVGGSGFIGRELVKKLSLLEDLRIVAAHREELAESDKIANIEYRKIDLAENGEAAHSIWRTADVVALLARPNDALFRNFLKIAEKSDFKKIIYASSLLVYPDSQKRHTESSDPDPRGEYEEAKIREENLLKQIASPETRVCIARLGNVYGNEKSAGVVSRMAGALEKNIPFVVNGDGGHTRDYIFVEDVAEALKKLIINPQEHDWEIFNVCTGVGTSINQLLCGLEKVAGRKMERKIGSPMPEKRCVIGDNGKITRVLNFSPKFDITNGLAETYRRWPR